MTELKDISGTYNYMSLTSKMVELEIQTLLDFQDYWLDHMLKNPDREEVCVRELQRIRRALMEREYYPCQNQ